MKVTTVPPPTPNNTYLVEMSEQVMRLFKLLLAKTAHSVLADKMYSELLYSEPFNSTKEYMAMPWINLYNIKFED